MFDIGFWELTIIGLIALLVIGPDKLPEVARTVGKWVGRTKRFVAQVKDDVNIELRQEEIRKALERDADLEEIKQIMNTETLSIEEEVASIDPDYQVKAIPDEKEEAEEEFADSSGEPHPEYEPFVDEADVAEQQQLAESENTESSVEESDDVKK